MTDIQMDAAGLRSLRDIALRNQNLYAWSEVALLWATEAEKEIRKLRNDAGNLGEVVKLLERIEAKLPKVPA